MNDSSKEIAEKTFRKYDTNNSGYIELSELQAMLIDVAKEIGITPPEESEINDLFKDYDSNKDKKISETEFIDLFKVILDMKQQG
jgi:Ca2+-binding EF-hand superfamily protein